MKYDIPKLSSDGGNWQSWFMLFMSFLQVTAKPAHAAANGDNANATAHKDAPAYLYLYVDTGVLDDLKTQTFDNAKAAMNMLQSKFVKTTSAWLRHHVVAMNDKYQATICLL